MLLPAYIGYLTAEILQFQESWQSSSLVQAHTCTLLHASPCTDKGTFIAHYQCKHVSAAGVTTLHHMLEVSALTPPTYTSLTGVPGRRFPSREFHLCLFRLVSLCIPWNSCIGTPGLSLPPLCCCWPRGPCMYSQSFISSIIADAYRFRTTTQS